MKKVLLIVALLVIFQTMVCPSAARVQAEGLSIYQIQYTNDAQGYSDYEGQVVDCRGGIVTHKFSGFRPKLTIQDANYPEGWGGIQVKDWLSGAPLFNQVNVGDRITLSNVYVEEAYGNTILQCWSEYNPSLSVVSTQNPLPEYLEVEISEIVAPAPEGYGQWLVADHQAEKYEAMRLRVRQVRVTQMDLGKAKDNYVLESPLEPNQQCWAADYMNVDALADYHEYVEIGARFCVMRGILEQYTRLDNGFDYYQLLSTESSDFRLPAAGDLVWDCRVDLIDLSFLGEYWLQSDCGNQDCIRCDLDGSGTIDTIDLMHFIQNWLVEIR